MKKIILTLVTFCSLFLIEISATAQNNKETKIDFKIKNIGMYVDGTFSEATITANFDKNNLANSFINANIDVASINTNNEKRDKHLLSNDYFDVATYKEMKLVSTKIEKVSANGYRLTGNLTIKKATKTVVIPLVINENETSFTINGNFELNRRDFGVGGSSWVLSNRVKIQVKHILKNN